MVPGPRLFRSRWTALLWAAGIVWLAVDVAADHGTAHPSKTGAPTTTDVTGTPVDDGDTRNAVSALDSVS